MSHTSVAREQALEGLIVQPRDITVLGAVLACRYARIEHIQGLQLQQVSRRVLQTRLKKLSEHGYLKRLYIPAILDGENAPLTHPRQPIYTLSSRGLRLLREWQAIDPTVLERARPELVSFTTLAHHLVVTDCLTALSAAVATSGITLAHSEHEGMLWSKLRAHRRRQKIRQALVPDGAFTLHYPTPGETLTFYLEVVRADVRGGNRRLGEKLRRYAELLRQGFFREVYGHERIRAVLFATTSTARAQHLARVAEKLTHGRRLFWFGSYQEKTPAGRFASRFTSDQILALPWLTADGEVLSLLQPHASFPEKGAP